MQRDYRREKKRTVETLGLAGKSVEDMIRLIS
jgi:hypothetical protein